jgi:hypothetical protein
MEVIYKCGDSITIPEGCKAIVKDGSVVFEKGQEFKDGDILVSVGNGKRYNAFIYKSTDKGGFHSYYYTIRFLSATLQAIGGAVVVYPTLPKKKSNYSLTR